MKLFDMKCGALGDNGSEGRMVWITAKCYSVGARRALVGGVDDVCADLSMFVDDAGLRKLAYQLREAAQLLEAVVEMESER